MLNSVTVKLPTEADLARIVAARSAALQAALGLIVEIGKQPGVRLVCGPDDIMETAAKFENWILRDVSSA